MHITWTIAVFFLFASAADKPPLALPAHVRADGSASRVLERAEAGSATVRELMARLADSDVIVYVEMTASPQIPTARTKLVTATASTRFLRIGLNSALTPYDLPALLAHELQHAVEIAEQEEVRDEAGVRRLYTRIGHQHGVDSYETDAARQVERRVRDEMRRLPAA